MVGCNYWLSGYSTNTESFKKISDSKQIFFITIAISEKTKLYYLKYPYFAAKSRMKFKFRLNNKKKPGIEFQYQA